MGAAASLMRRTVIRNYQASDQSAATEFLEIDIERLEAEEYEVVSLNWERGQWSFGSFLFALALC